MIDILGFRRPVKPRRPIKILSAFFILLVSHHMASCGRIQTAQTSSAKEMSPNLREAVPARARKALALASSQTAVFEGVQTLKCTLMRIRFSQFERSVGDFKQFCIENDQNRGPIIDEIQKAVEGETRTGKGPNNGRNWCASFLQWLVLNVEKEEPAFKSRLPATRYAVQQVSRAPKCIFHPKGVIPEAGWIVVWQKSADKTRGHTEMVISANRADDGSVVMDSIGGNTTGTVGETDGEEVVAPKNLPQGIRPRLSQDPEKMRDARLLGYVNPWIGTSDECRDSTPVGEIP